jgi:hypothetical protein
LASKYTGATGLKCGPGRERFLTTEGTEEHIGSAPQR